MIVDIYIREKDGDRELRIPVLPERIMCDTGEATFASYDILNKGEVAVPTGTALSGISWESVFPGKDIQEMYPLRGTWSAPKVCHNTLVEWKEKRTKLNVLVTGFPINVDVYIKDYSAEMTGAFGDINYEITFVEARDITVKTSKVSTSSKRSSSTSSTYIIKSGDTLWSIAQKFYGDGSKWTIIYDANKDIIEKTAKERWAAVGINRGSEYGYWIFPGIKLSIPSADGISSTGGGGSVGHSPSLNNAKRLFSQVSGGSV